VSRSARRTLAALAIVVLGAVAAAAPPPIEKEKSPGPVQPQPTSDIGRKPGRPAPGRGKAKASGNPRRASGTTPTRSVSVTVQVRPAPDTGPESPPNLSFRMGQSTPNPFHASTTIAFANPARAAGTLTVYDVQGKRVATLLDGVVEAGEYTIQWNGAGDSGKLLAPGVYVYRLRIGNHESVKKLVFSH
jgi:hypothetical protein